MKINVWVPLGTDVLTALTFGRSDAQILISVEVYMLHLCAFGTTQCYILAKSNRTAIVLKKIPPARQAFHSKKT